MAAAEKAPAKKAAKAVVKKAAVKKVAIRRLIIAVLEAEMNLAIFTPGGDIIAQIESGKITVSVVDQGPGISDIELAMQPGYSTAPDFIRELGFGAAMGLPNIKNCTDEMNLESTVGKGTHLQFAVYSSNEAEGTGQRAQP